MTTASSGKSSILLYGVLYGVTSIAYTVILYLGGVAAYMHSANKYIGVAIALVFAILPAWHLKKQQGGYLEFSDALKSIFKVLVIGIFLSTLFDYILFHYIDVPFREALTQASIDAMVKEMENSDMSDEKIEETVEFMSKFNSYGLAAQALAFAIRCILHFILALIVSAIMKKKRPVFENTFNQ
ncbi:DUF4199 domain-containing protein [Niastella caeni]|uniref:DUF4199 domain-containing protein n=1 Tax=Niastella caeni TaxID=2569763 RepID=A0A4S8HSH1_9BACT|nr:DUF4199 domain-containing protein [Niastella caeni]THU38400.1 DUF4199 domain-containing protein [Niastella caeni]